MKRAENILVLGLGGMGRYLAGRLSHDGHHVTVIESDRDKIRRADAELDARLIQGDAMSFECWKEARAEAMDYLIAVTDDDPVNMMASVIADKMGVRQKIARIRAVEVWREDAPLKARDLAIDLVIRPAELAAQEIVRLLKMRAGHVVVDVGDGRLQVMAAHVRRDSVLAHRTLRDLAREYSDFRFQVVAVARDLVTLIPDGNFEILPDDHVYLMARRQNIPRLMDWTGETEDEHLQRVLVIGGGLVGSRVAQLLEPSFEVRVLENDERRAEALSYRLDHAMCLHGDGSEQSTLLNAGLFHTDTVIAATGDNETNVMTCLLAKHLVATRHGEELASRLKTIAMVKREDYALLASAMGTDITVSMKVLAANQILRHIRRGHVLSVAHLHGCDAEVVELLASPGSPITRRPVAQIEGLRGHILLGAVHRDDGWSVVRGTTQLRAGDRVVCVCTSDQMSALQALFL